SALREPGAAASLLSSPHNPTGNVWSRAYLAMVADACQRHGAVLLVDEIHAPLALPGARFVPFLAIDHELTRAETTFTFTSATKGWNIPGLKCGLAVAGTQAGARPLGGGGGALGGSQPGALAAGGALTPGV